MKAFQVSRIDLSLSKMPSELKTCLFIFNKKVEYKTSSLNSNDAFVISYENSNKFYVWYGKGSTGDEREAAKSLVIAHKKEPEIVIESQEKEDFWKVFPDGKQAYHSEKRLQNSESLNICRLFEITNVSGRIGVNEIYQFTQEDLNTNEVMLLDAWDSMFIWIGKRKLIRNIWKLCFEVLIKLNYLFKIQMRKREKRPTK